MNAKEIKENELYFSRVLDTLAEGGVFGWKDLGEILVKTDGKFQCSMKAYNKAQQILSKNYFDKYFSLK